MPQRYVIKTVCVFGCVCVRMQRGQIKDREYYQADLDNTQVADLGGLVSEAVPKSTASYSALTQQSKHKSCLRSSSNMTELRLPYG